MAEEFEVKVRMVPDVSNKVFVEAVRSAMKGQKFVVPIKMFDATAAINNLRTKLQQELSNVQIGVTVRQDPNLNSGTGQSTSGQSSGASGAAKLTGDAKLAEIALKQLDGTYQSVIKSLHGKGLDSEPVKQLTSAYERLKGVLDAIRRGDQDVIQQVLSGQNIDVNNINNAIDGVRAYKSAATELSKMDAVTSNVEAAFKNMAKPDTASLDLYKLKVDACRTALQQFASGSISFDEFQKRFTSAAAQAGQLGVKLKDIIKTSHSMSAVNSEIKKVETLLQNSKFAASEYGGQLREVLTVLQYLQSKGVYNKGDLDWARSRIREITAEWEKQNGVVQGVGQTIRTAVLKVLKQRIGSMLFTYARRGAKEMAEAVRELNNQMTQLRIVTGATDSEMSVFLEHATAKAKELGANIQSVLDSIEVFSRLGYDLEDSLEFANAATLLQNVGATTVDAATTGLTSIVKGFGLDSQDASLIADKLTLVGKKYAISAEELMTAFENGGAQMAAANNSLDETIAIFAAGNAAIQNASKVGTAMKTVSARIRGATAELDEMGEEYDDLVGSTAKYREEILALSGVDIMLDESTFKSTYQILLEIAQVWDSIEDVQQAALLERLAGKRNSQVLMSVIENIDDLTGAYRDQVTAAGEATKANEIYMESVDAKIGVLKATAESLSAAYLDSEYMNIAVEAATALLELLIKMEPIITPLLMLFAGSVAIDGAKLLVTKLSPIFATTTKMVSSLMGVFTAGSITRAAADAKAAVQLLGGEIARLAGTAAGQYTAMFAPIAAVIWGAKVANDALQKSIDDNYAAVEEMTSGMQNTIDVGGTYAEQVKSLSSIINDETAQDYQQYTAKQSLIQIQEDLMASQADVAKEYGIEIKQLDLLAEQAEGATTAYREWLRTIASSYLSNEQFTTQYEVAQARLANPYAFYNGVGALWGDFDPQADQATVDNYVKMSIWADEELSELDELIADAVAAAQDAIESGDYGELSDFNLGEVKLKIDGVDDTDVKMYFLNALNANKDTLSVISAVNGLSGNDGAAWAKRLPQIFGVQSGEGLTKYQVLNQLDTETDFSEIFKYAANTFGVTTEQLADILVDLGYLVDDQVSSLTPLIGKGAAAQEVLETLWGSEEFSNAKESLIELAEEADGISGDKVEELADSSKELRDVLEVAGMDAEFLAHVLQTEITSGNGFDLITDDALELNSALNDSIAKFRELDEARQRYEDGIANEKNDGFLQVADAYDAAMGEIAEGTTNSNQFWAQAEYLLGAEYLAEIGYSSDLAAKAIKNLQKILDDEEQNGSALYTVLQNIADEEGNIIDANGKLLGVINDTGFDLPVDNWAALADIVGMSEEAFTACLTAWEMFTQISWNDLDTVVQVLKDIGYAVEDDAGIVVDWADLSAYLSDVLGKQVADIGRLYDRLESSGITFGDVFTPPSDDTIGATEAVAGAVDDVSGGLEDINNTSLDPAIKNICEYTDSILAAKDALSETKAVLDSIAQTGPAPINTYSAPEYVNAVRNGVSAYAGGTVNSRPGKAVVNEFGPELIWAGDHAYIANNGRPAMVDLKRGSMVYTAEETKDILAGGRDIVFGAHAVGGKIPDTSGTHNYTVGGASGTGGGGSQSDDFSETLDYIIILLDRIERNISNLETIAENSYNSYSDRNNALNETIAWVRTEINAQQDAYSRYIQQANSVGLPETYKNLVVNGTIDISTITDEALYDKITEYQDWYEKALDCKDALIELSETLSSLYEEKFAQIESEFDGVLSRVEHASTMIDNYINKAEAAGYIISAKYYEALIKVEKENAAVLKDEQAALVAQLNNAVNSGAIAVYSEAWYDLQSQIDDVTAALVESQTALIEYENSIRQLDWDRFDQLEERISGVAGEADWLISLLENSELFDDKGGITDEGLATMGLHVQNYSTYVQQMKDYADELAKVNAALAEDPADTALVERKQELVEAYRDVISAAEDEKQALKDLVAEGIELQLDAVQELIDTYADSLDSAKDLYDYQKNVEEQTENIASLEKQLAAYKGDTSEEARAKVQQLRVSLDEAKSDLEETEYDRYVSDTKELLDELYTDFETVLNERLDDINALLENCTAAVEEGADVIAETITGIVGGTGYTLSDALQTIWPGEKGAAVMDGVIVALGNIEAAINRLYTSSDEAADADISSSENSPAAVGTPSPEVETPPVVEEAPVESVAPAGSFFIKKKNNTAKNKLSINTSIVDRLKYNDFDSSFAARASYYSAMGFSGKYTGSAAQNSKMISWMKSNGYKRGVFGLASDELAWTQEGAPEAIIRPSDNAVLMKLKRRDSVLTAAATENLWDMARDPESFIAANSRRVQMCDMAGGNNISNAIQLSITLPNVTNYEEFMNAASSDPKFEKLVQAMTTDRLAGRNSMSKNTIHW